MHYAPPNGPSPNAQPAAPRTSRTAIAALILGVAALVVFPVLMVLGALAAPKKIGVETLGFFGVCGAISAVAALICAIVALATLGAGDSKGKLLGILSIVAAVASAATGTVAAGVGILFTATPLHGRPLRRKGEPLLPEAGPCGAPPSWGASTDDASFEIDVASIPQDVRLVLAAAWLADARAEHASVAAFSRLALDLLALNAPPELVLAAHRAATDEVHHARIGYSLASRYAGESLEPSGYGSIAGVEAREVSLASVARESLVEGVVGEGACSARLLADAARAVDPIVAGHLMQLAHDEARHAELARDVVRFCVSKAGSGLARELTAALSASPASATTSTDSNDETLVRHGRSSASDWRDAHRSARTEALGFLASLVERGPMAPAKARLLDTEAASPRA